MIGYFAVAGLILIFGAMLAAHAKGLIIARRTHQKTRLFAKFEKSLTNESDEPELANQVFKGQIKLEQLVYVIIPEALSVLEVESRYHIPIAEELAKTGIGEVVRSYSMDDNCGLDVMLNDFVSGVDLIRRILIAQKTPKGTLIEYSGGDLLVYDD